VPGPAKSHRRLFAAAQARLRANKPDEAATLFLEIAALPDLERDEPLALESAHLGLADIYLATRRIELAEYHIRKALAVSPGEADIHRRLGDVCAYTGRFPAAAAAFLRAVELVPHHPEYLHRLGWATFMAGEQRKGRRLMEDALFLDEANTGLLGDLATAAEELGDRKAALRHLDRAAELDPANELLRSRRERLRERLRPGARKP